MFQLLYFLILIYLQWYSSEAVALQYLEKDKNNKVEMAGDEDRDDLFEMLAQFLLNHRKRDDSKKLHTAFIPGMVTGSKISNTVKCKKKFKDL